MPSEPSPAGAADDPDDELTRGLHVGEPSGDGMAPQGDDLLAVIAHSLLGSISVVVGGIELLTTHWPNLDVRERTELLDTMRGQAAHVAAALDNLVRLGDPHLIQVLDELQHEDGAEPGTAVQQPPEGGAAPER